MPGEELFQLNKKINQIKNNINKRKQKVSEWNVPYRKILEEKKDKSTYIDKFYSQKEKGVSCQFKIKEKVKLSRRKINEYHNELKQLDELIKWKSIIRSKKFSKSEANYSHNKDSEEEPKREVRKLQNQKTLMNQSCTQANFSRTLKNRLDPFQNAKVQKFIDFYSQMKNGEDVRPQMMKTFGVGLQNTPLGRMIGQESKKDENKNLNENGEKAESKKGKINFVQNFNKTFNQKENIFGSISKPNLFENRMKKIIKYHGDFWKQEFQIK